MKKGVAFGLPAVAATGVAGAAVLAGTGHHAPWLMFVWTSLIAVLFLVGCISVVLLRAFRWLWPLGAGFVTQTVGVILLATEVGIRSPWETVWWTLGVVGTVLLVMVVAWITVTIRAHWLEKNMIRGVGGESGGDDLAKIRENIADALEKLRQAGGRGAIYALPWFLVIGRSGVGKTVAIKNSGLGLPSRKDWVKGVGGTITLNFFFTSDLIFLDTPGKWVDDGAEAQEQQQWLETLRLLRKYRGRRPLDGIVATCSADDLLSLPDDRLRDKALRVREVIDLLYAETRFRFPIYLLITKCDLVEGFVEFFRNLAPQRKNEILGASFEDPESVDPRRDVPKAFGKMIRRLERFRLEGLARLVGSGRARRLFFFVEELRRIQQPLTVFTTELFGGDRFHDAPVFRGFYLTSGTQGEGMPLAHAMGDLVRGLGVKVSSKTAEGEKEPEKSYFLKDLFRKLMVTDDGLVGRTAVHWWRERRNTFFVAFLPATLSLIVLAMASISFVLNRAAFERSATEVARAARTVDDVKKRSVDGESIHGALVQTGQMLDAHDRITRWSLFRTWGMHQYRELSAYTLLVFRNRFKEHVLDPTLEEANRIISDPANMDCAEKMRVLGAVVYLASGHRWEGQGRDLGGFETVWKMKNAEEEREEIRRQFRALLQETDDDIQWRSLLEGFKIEQASIHVADSCGSATALSALAKFKTFQDDCQSATDDQDIEDCYRRLSEVITWKPADYEVLHTTLAGLKDDLRDLEDEKVPGAAEARVKLKNLDFDKPDSSVCPEMFREDLIPAIQELAWQTSIVEQFQKAVEGRADRVVPFRDTLNAHKPDLDKREAILQQKADAFIGKCPQKSTKLGSIDTAFVKRLTLRHLQVACLGMNAPPAPIKNGERRGSDRIVVERIVVPRSSLSMLEQPRIISSYRQSVWQEKRRGWDIRLKAVGDIPLSEAQKSAERQAVRTEIQAYAKNYVDAWQRYLRGLRVIPQSDDVSPSELAKWLEQLAQSSEFDVVFKEPKSALSIQEKEDPFSEMENSLGGMAKLPGDLDVLLAQYRKYLLEVAVDLRKCEEPKFRQAYLNSLDQRPLGDALRWVTINAGPEQVLAGLFRYPLDAAKKALGGTDLLGSTWSNIVTTYGKLEGSLLFAEQDGNVLPDETVLATLLGGESGLVANANDARTKGAVLSADANAWLDRATRLSRLVFKTGQTLRPVTLSVTVDSTSIEPRKIADDFSLDEFEVYLGTGAKFAWKEGGARNSDPLLVRLIGDDAFRRSSIQAIIKKKARRPTTHPQTIEATGVAAPLKLLAKGRADGQMTGLVSGDILEFGFPVEDDGKKKGTLTVKLRVDGDDLAKFLSFLEKGLPPPPATAK